MNEIILAPYDVISKIKQNSSDMNEIILAPCDAGYVQSCTGFLTRLLFIIEGLTAVLPTLAPSSSMTSSSTDNGTDGAILHQKASKADDEAAFHNLVVSTMEGQEQSHHNIRFTLERSYFLPPHIILRDLLTQK
jgi:hypothetical protein